MTVEIDLSDLSESVFRMAKKGLLGKRDPQKFINDFRELYNRDPNAAVLKILKEKLEEEMAVYGYLKSLIEIKFVDFVNPHLEEELRNLSGEGANYLVQAAEFMKKAMKTLEEQIARIESGEPIEIIFKVEKK